MTFSPLEDGKAAARDRYSTFSPPLLTPHQLAPNSWRHKCGNIFEEEKKFISVVVYRSRAQQTYELTCPTFRARTRAMWRKLPPVFFFYFHALTVAAMTAGRCGNAVDPVYQNKKFPIILRVWESIVWTKLKEEKICCVSVSLCSRTWQFLFFFLIDFFVC